VTFDIDELRQKLNDIDTKYYKNLDEKALIVRNNEVTKQVARDILRRAEQYFQKGTPEDAAYGIVYRKIAKELLDSLIS
jgi:hypothetical protein